MRILQLIDSLRPGGAEQMAVSYANAFAKSVDSSYLCCTRLEGSLKKKLAPDVNFIFLKKKRTLDLKAFWKLHKYVKKNKIDLIQAHSSSWFLALLIKLSLMKVKLVWHDHHGIELNKRRPRFLKAASFFFDGIISVNAALKQWAEENLFARQVKYFRNFLPASQFVTALDKPFLKGNDDDFKIICVANFRPQKDHLNLLKAFKILIQQEEKVSLHLVGKVEKDNYSEVIKNFIAGNNLNSNVFLYGEQENITDLLGQAELGVLSSASEGLPVTLLEYGQAGLPVVATAVGEIPQVTGRDAKLVAPKSPDELAAALFFYIHNRNERDHDAENLKIKIITTYSVKAVIPEVVLFFEQLVAGENVKP